MSPQLIEVFCCWLSTLVCIQASLMGCREAHAQLAAAGRLIGSPQAVKTLEVVLNQYASFKDYSIVIQRLRSIKSVLHQILREVELAAAPQQAAGKEEPTQPIPQSQPDASQALEPPQLAFAPHCWSAAAPQSAPETLITKKIRSPSSKAHKAPPRKRKRRESGSLLIPRPAGEMRPFGP